MSARDLIASELARISRVDMEEAPAYARASVRTAALRVERALTSSGYRILGPDEIDAVTVEKCARASNGWSPRNDIGKRIATAIRALCATHHGDK